MGKTALNLPTGQQTFRIDPAKVVLIGLDTPDVAGTHFLYDERVHLPVNPIMVKGIKVYGVHDAIDVIKDGDRVLCLHGRQRVKNARQANVELEAEHSDLRVTVECKVIRSDELGAFARNQRANSHRQEDQPIVKARAAQHMMDLGIPEELVMLNLHCESRQTLRGWLDLLTLAPDLQKAVADGKVSAKRARAVVDAPHDEQAALATAPPIKRGPKGPRKPKETGTQAVDESSILKIQPSNVPSSANGTPAPLEPVNMVRPSVQDIRDILEVTGNAVASAVLRWVLGDASDAETAKLVPGWPTK